MEHSEINTTKHRMPKSETTATAIPKLLLSVSYNLTRDENYQKFSNMNDNLISKFYIYHTRRSIRPCFVESKARLTSFLPGSQSAPESII